MYEVYDGALTIHSWLRWATLILAIAATLNAWRRDTDISRRPPGRQWDVLFMLALDLQVLFGLALYFGLSPYTMLAFDDFGAAMHNPTLRFWTVQHVGFMLSANVLVRVGRVQALNAKTAETRRKRRFLFFVLTTLAIVAGIPWPGLTGGRPLFRI